jgi:hypothetical protein
MWCEDVDWIHIVLNRLDWWVFENLVMNLRVPKKAEKFLTS